MPSVGCFQNRKHCIILIFVPITLAEEGDYNAPKALVL